MSVRAWMATAITLTCVAPAQAEGETLALDFRETPAPYRIGTEAYTDRWAYYVTRGVSVFPITHERQVRRYLNWRAGDDRRACGLNTRGNYVALVRRVPESFAHARQLRWQWHVTQDTPRGRFGQRPDDQALQVILIFKYEDPVEYVAISFAWTRADDRDVVLYATRLPQDDFPRVQVSVNRLRSGRLAARQERIDIREAFRETVEQHGGKFTKRSGPVPPLFGIVLFGESSNQRPPVDPEQMSTEAVVARVELVK